ncbi:MAG: hypothetical protein K6T92_04305, partial [Candidatus Rokubacteria bacterium]|nr:hypothetical protein [Candidatus Rokubacteria bacterium]
GYPVPEAAFIGSADPFEGRVAFTFRLNSVGRRPDGSPLVVRPGSYTIQAGGTEGTLFVRPAETPPRVAAVKDGMIVTWSAGEGVRSQSLAEEDIPRRRGDMAYTWVTTRLRPARLAA